MVEVADAEAVRGHAFDGSAPEFAGMDADVEQALLAGEIFLIFPTPAFRAGPAGAASTPSS
jgi:hypothetical protein